MIGQFQEGKITTISTEDYSVITENILKNLYKTKAILCIENEDYSIIINGKNIVNYANELSTDLNIKDTSKGREFTINDHNNLPGKITVSMNKDKSKYLYLLNSKTKKYQNLQVKDTANMNIDEAGKYLLTDKKVSSLTINKWIVIIAIIMIVMLCIGYVVMKKKYWFW